MAGHSKWATTKRQKGINDAKRAAVFTRLGNLIAIAARGGADPTMNSALAMAIEKAKAANMPASNIQRAIDRVGDKNSATVEEITYEAIGPAGVAIIIEVATDNRNRTLPEVKSTLTKNGGRLADPGSVMFQFTRKGVIRVQAQGEEALLQVLEAGAEDAVEEENELIVYTDQKDLAKVRYQILEQGLAITSADLQYVANQQLEVDDEETNQKIIKLLEAIDDLDDITNIYTNI